MTAGVAASVGRIDPRATPTPGGILMAVTASLSEAARRELTGLGDRVTGPGDAGYDEARAVHNGMIDRHPGLIVSCASPAEVARTIAFGREHSVPIAVRGGGHNGGGLGTVA